MLEHAGGMLLNTLVEEMVSGNPIFIDDHELAWLNFANQFSIDQGKTTVFRCDYTSLIKLAQKQWSNPEWITNANEFAIDDHGEGKSTLDLFQCIAQAIDRILMARFSKEMADHFGVRLGMKNRAFAL